MFVTRRKYNQLERQYEAMVNLYGDALIEVVELKVELDSLKSNTIKGTK